MCSICVAAQDLTPASEHGATYDAWERFGAALDAWMSSLPDDHEAHDMSEVDRALAWCEHMDATTADRVVN